MHRIIRDHLEEVLTGLGSAPEHPAGKHLTECAECRDAVAAMREQAAVLRQWRPAEVENAEPRPGFYARVLERIDAQAPGSVFALFFDSVFGRRIAMASLALALLLGVYVVSSEQKADLETAGAGRSPQATLGVRSAPGTLRRFLRRCFLRQRPDTVGDGRTRPGCRSHESGHLS